MVDDEDFDVIIVGAGLVGIEVAERAARGGLRAMVIERRLVGGECNYYGCVPSKALLWPGCRRLGSQSSLGSHVRRPRCSRSPARRDDRRHRRGSPRSPLARGARIPNDERDLVRAPKDLRTLT